jgi:hypothetical protein
LNATRFGIGDGRGGTAGKLADRLVVYARTNEDVDSPPLYWALETLQAVFAIADYRRAQFADVCPRTIFAACRRQECGQNMVTLGKKP